MSVESETGHVAVLNVRNAVPEATLHRKPRISLHEHMHCTPSSLRNNRCAWVKRLRLDHSFFQDEARAVAARIFTCVTGGIQYQVTNFSKRLILELRRRVLQ
jgi:hypothetical protein